jgi:hypothetical protein
VSRERRVVIAYPFLAAAYPVLALAAAHAGELVSPWDLLRPAAIALAVAAVGWALSRLVSREPNRRGIVTFVAVIIFSTYGYWETLLGDVLSLRHLAEARFLLPTLLGLLLLTVVAARRPGQSSPAVTRYLNLTFGLLVLGSAVVVAWRTMRARPAITVSDIPAGPATVSGMQPHLFIIVLDKYTGPQSLRANFGYDNGPFERFLESRGFRVARNAHANYVHTFLALASMLNWDYVGDVADSLGEEHRWSALYEMIDQNRTARYLKQRGYRFVFFPTAFAATAGSDYADVQLPDPEELTREFEMVWFRTTMLYPIADYWCLRRPCVNGIVPYVAESAVSFDWKFAQLARLATAESPLLVFAHVTLPHEPYVFDETCRHIRPYWPTRDDGPDAEPVKRAYVAQIQCVNRKLGRLIDTVQRTAGRPVVMVLQADHGHGRLGRDLPPIEEVPPEKLQERLDIFAAYLLPGAPADLVHDSIGPVNAMRAIMRHYYGLSLPPLEEASYWSWYLRPYHLTRVR